MDSIVWPIMCKSKEHYTPRVEPVGCSSALLRPQSCRWINHWSLWCMASLTCDWYQIILLGHRGTCVWTTCSRLLPSSEMAGSQTCNVFSRKPTPYHYSARTLLMCGYMLFQLKERSPANKQKKETAEFTKIHIYVDLRLQ